MLAAATEHGASCIDRHSAASASLYPKLLWINGEFNSWWDLDESLFCPLAAVPAAGTSSSEGCEGDVGRGTPLTIQMLPFADEAWREFPVLIWNFAMDSYDYRISKVRMSWTCKDIHRWFYSRFDP